MQVGQDALHAQSGVDVVTGLQSKVHIHDHPRLPCTPFPRTVRHRRGRLWAAGKPPEFINTMCLVLLPPGRLGRYEGRRGWGPRSGWTVASLGGGVSSRRW